MSDVIENEIDNSQNPTTKNENNSDQVKSDSFDDEFVAEFAPDNDNPRTVSEDEENVGLDKALNTYRKLVEKKSSDVQLTDEEKERLEAQLDAIKNRDVVENVVKHTPTEMPCEGQKDIVGPPTLTRFEKARIMGARALQLSQGAPPFIPIPKSARISLDISMEELNQRAIPITIRRVLPNGDYQNIPISYFEK